MRKLILIGSVVLLFAVVPALAQEHVEASVFGDYLNLRHADQGFWGVGGLLGFHIAPHTALEGDVAYDFAQSFTTTDTAGFTTNSSLHLWHGTFGPKFYVDFGPLRAFVFAKGGFLSFSGVHTGSVGSNFTNQVETFPG